VRGGDGQEHYVHVTVCAREHFRTDYFTMLGEEGGVAAVGLSRIEKQSVQKKDIHFIKHL
jgi:hypothetical protein